MDSDLSRDFDKRKNTTRYIFTLGSIAISWVSQLQKIVALSSTETEYIVATEANKEIVWLQNLMKELEKKQENSMSHSDSQSVIHLVKNSAFHARTKHIDRRHHFIHSLLEEKVLRLEKIHMDDNPANMFTKAVTTVKLKLCKASVGF